VNSSSSSARTQVRTQAQTLSLAILAWLLAVAPSLLHAETDPDDSDTPAYEGYLGWDQALVPRALGHGIVSIVARFPRSLADADLTLTYDTDTAALSVERAASKSWLWNTALRAQGAAAGLLIDYFERGVRIEERGFYASYLEGTAGLEFQASPHTLRWNLSTKRWVFFRADDAVRSDYQLPSDQWALSQSSEYVFWNIAFDPSWSDWHRTIQRTSGFAAGARLTFEGRLGNRPWGRITDGRNKGEKLQGFIEQWAAGGVFLSPRVRLQMREELRWSWRDDDLNRTRVGGTNRYVVRIGGMPWASFLSSRHVFVHAGPRVALAPDSEIGLEVDGGWMADPGRVGARDEIGLLYGVQAFVDWRPDELWQLDLRLGWSPAQRWLNGGPYFNLYASLGRRWE
jgi:hypothetical protein